MTTRFRAYGPKQLTRIADHYPLDAELRETIRLFSLVLPFRVNSYVLDELIDWKRVPDDPTFRLVFPQPGMLDAEDERTLAALSDSPKQLAEAIARIRKRLNPHPAGQQDLNVPELGGVPVAGVQHKYRETALYFPGNGQTCHAYCTYCFRWAQFVGDNDLRFTASNPTQLIDYLTANPQISDVLLTGGDPMVMSEERLRGHLEPLLHVESVRTIRIGTKSIAYWPNRYLDDPDADETLRLFERVVATGRTLAVMAHFSHAGELTTEPAQRALARIRSTGAVIYCQAPIIAHVNDKAQALLELWRAELAAGAVPYYAFVARDTGPRDYFKVPLARAATLFTEAYRQLPGLARTVRGPVMSTTPGKVVVEGTEDTPEGRYFRLRFLQARDPNLVGRPFRANWSQEAAWLDDLTLAPSTPPDIAAVVE
jgi:L-lysine 2,3-aminomutase